jgi:hypothetical protein
MNIQPSSAAIKGNARARTGRIWLRIDTGYPSPLFLCKVFQIINLSLDFDDLQVSGSAKRKAPFGGAFIVGVSIIGVQVETVCRM